MEFIKNLPSKRRTWVLIIVFSFMIVDIFSLTFIAIDGDHADSLTYHLFGRNPDMHLPFASYHGMIDILLTTLPDDEYLLTVVTFLVSSISIMMLVVGIMMLVFDWVGILTSQQKSFTVALALIALPEFFYLGLVYHPTIIATLFVVISHILLRKMVRKNYGFGLPLLLRLFVTAAIFGFGIAFRWNVIPYGGIIFIDILTYDIDQKTDHQFRKVSLGQAFQSLFAYALWGLSALFFTLIFIRISGYGIDDIIHVFNNPYFDEAFFTVDLRTLLTLLPLITPATLICGSIGFILLVVRRNWLVLIVVFSLATVVPWIPQAAPKLLVTGFPAIVLCIIVGFTALWYELGGKILKPLSRITLLLLLVVPWFVGIRVMSEGSAWGPGFEYRAYDREETEGVELSFTIGAGAAIQTPEGERPIFGHAFVLLGGEWRSYSNSFAKDVYSIADYAIETDLPILVISWPETFVVNRLLELGFTTEDNQNNLLELNDYFFERTFTNAEGIEVNVIYQEIVGEGTIEDIMEIASLSEKWDQIVISGYTRTMRNLYNIAPSVMSKANALTAVVDLNELSTVLDQ